MPAPHNSVFTGWMPLLLPNQQCQSTEGSLIPKSYIYMYCDSHVSITFCYDFEMVQMKAKQTNLALSLIVFTALLTVCMWDGHTESLVDIGHTKHRSSVAEGWPPINSNCNSFTGCSTTLYQPRPVLEQCYKPTTTLVYWYNKFLELSISLLTELNFHEINL